MEKIHIVILPIRVSNIWDLTKYFFLFHHAYYFPKEREYLFVSISFPGSFHYDSGKGSTVNNSIDHENSWIC